MTDRVRSRILVLAGISGAVMVLLAFAPWVQFKSIDVEGFDELNLPKTTIDLRGTETSRFRDTEVIEIDTIQSEDGWCSCRVGFGDGYFVALAGVLVAASAGLAFATRRDTLFGSLMAVAALGSLALATVNALADWQAIAWTDVRQTEPVEGDATPLLWGLMFVSAIAALCGAILWGVGIGMAEQEDDEELEYEDENAGEVQRVGVMTTIAYALVDQTRSPNRTKHYLGLPPEVAQDAVRTPMLLADVVVIGPGPFLSGHEDDRTVGWFLHRYAANGEFAGDTWHETLDDAKAQAEFEYDTGLGEWHSEEAETLDELLPRLLAKV